MGRGTLVRPTDGEDSGLPGRRRATRADRPASRSGGRRCPRGAPGAGVGLLGSGSQTGSQTHPFSPASGSPPARLPLTLVGPRARIRGTGVAEPTFGNHPARTSCCRQVLSGVPSSPPTRAADTGSIGPGRPHSPEQILTHAGRTCAAGSPRRLAAAPQVPPVPLAWELHPREPDALSPQNAHPNTNSSSVSNFQNVESTQMSMD